MGMIARFFGFLTGKSAEKSFPTLYFKDEISAFEYACKYQRFELVKDEFIPCYVDAVSIPPDGKAIAVIRIPHDGVETRMIASFLSSNNCQQLEGKLCVAVVGDVIEAMGVPALMIVAELSPELGKAWKIKRRL